MTYLRVLLPPWRIWFAIAAVFWIWRTLSYFKLIVWIRTSSQSVFYGPGGKLQTEIFCRDFLASTLAQWMLFLASALGRWVLFLAFARRSISDFFRYRIHCLFYYQIWIHNSPCQTFFKITYASSTIIYCLSHGWGKSENKIRARKALGSPACAAQCNSSGHQLQDKSWRKDWSTLPCDLGQEKETRIRDTCRRSSTERDWWCSCRRIWRGSNVRRRISMAKYCCEHARHQPRGISIMSWLILSYIF